MTDNGNGIYTIDSFYGRENMAAVYLIKEGNCAALVETANVYSLSHVKESITQLGLKFEDIKYIFLTHIHLDHAGGAGAYMEEFRNAKLVVHPKGFRHMADPSKLEAGVIAVYGKDFVEKMYGHLKPIDSERMISASNGAEFDLNGRKIICYDTPGHANHHMAIFDTKANSVFTGDVFGVAYPELVNSRNERFIFPTTTPVNFNPELMHASINLIANLQPESVYPTHFGELRNVSKYAQILHDMVDDFVNLALECKETDNKTEAITSKLNHYMWDSAEKFGITLNEDTFNNFVGMDNQISAQGLTVWLSKEII